MSRGLERAGALSRSADRGRTRSGAASPGADPGATPTATWSPAAPATPGLAGRPRRRVPSAAAEPDRGTGLIGTTVAITVFLTFLLFAVQLLFSLWTRTTVTSAAYDGARVAAGARAGSDGPDESVREQAEDRVRQQLGAAGREATIDWTGSDGDTITLRVQVDAPRFLSPAIAGPLATDHIDRTVRVRVERDR